MPELNHVEIDLDDRLFAALAVEAERLNLPTAEVVRRAVAAWVGEMADDMMPGVAFLPTAEA